MRKRHKFIHLSSVICIAPRFCGWCNMAFTLWNLFEASLLCLNAVCILHEERFLAKSKRFVICSRKYTRRLTYESLFTHASLVLTSLYSCHIFLRLAIFWKFQNYISVTGIINANHTVCLESTSYLTCFNFQWAGERTRTSKVLENSPLSNHKC